MFKAQAKAEAKALRCLEATLTSRTSHLCLQYCRGYRVGFFSHSCTTAVNYCSITSPCFLVVYDWFAPMNFSVITYVLIGITLNSDGGSDQVLVMVTTIFVTYFKLCMIFFAYTTVFLVWLSKSPDRRISLD